MIAIGKIDAVKSKINAITALMVVFLTALFAGDWVCVCPSA